MKPPAPGSGVRELRVFGIDPGTHTLGWGLVALRGTSLRLLEYGALTGGRGELPGRLLRIHDGLAQVLRRARPDVIAVERVFVAKDPRATITLGEGRGVALLAAARAVQAVGGTSGSRPRRGGAGATGSRGTGEPGNRGTSSRRVGTGRSLPPLIVEITPAEVKKAVAGNGAATKAQVQRMVQMQLGMERPPHPADAADALAVAICAALRRSVRTSECLRVGESERGRTAERSDAQTLRRSDSQTLHAGSLPADVLRRAFSKRR